MTLCETAYYVRGSFRLEFGMTSCKAAYYVRGSFRLEFGMTSCETAYYVRGSFRLEFGMTSCEAAYYVRGSFRLEFGMTSCETAYYVRGSFRQVCEASERSAWGMLLARIARHRMLPTVLRQQLGNRNLHRQRRSGARVRFDVHFAPD